MKTMKALSALLLAGGFTALACDENPDTPPLGDYSITATPMQTINGFATADGWNVKYTKFLVSFTAARVQGNDRVVATDGTAQVADLLAGPVTIISDRNRVARNWELVSFEIAPPSADTAPAVGEGGVAQIVGFSVYVSGSLTKNDAKAGPLTKQFEFGVAADTQYGGCSEKQSGIGVVSGLTISPGGTDNVAVGLAPEILFSDTLGSIATMRANAIANADLNNDGIVDTSELQKTTLDAARNETSTYLAPEINSLSDFVTAQSRSLVFNWRGDGNCTATPVVAAP